MIVRAPRELGLLVREVRRSKHLTQAELAERAGVGRDWISKLERGNRGAEVGHVLDTFHALELRISVILQPGQSPEVRKSIARLDDIVANARRPAG
jgi:HTH-type transcriptional regulator/antitoxin HipB